MYIAALTVYILLNKLNQSRHTIRLLRVYKRVHEPIPYTESPVAEEVDEVFAWDYDEAHPAATPVSQQTVTEQPPDIADEPDAELIHEEPACPNRGNTFHECSHYCTKRWGYVKWAPDETMATRREKLLKKHPLPDTWSEVGDPKTYVSFGCVIWRFHFGACEFRLFQFGMCEFDVFHFGLFHLCEFEAFQICALTFGACVSLMCSSLVRFQFGMCYFSAFLALYLT